MCFQAIRNDSTRGSGYGSAPVHSPRALSDALLNELVLIPSPSDVRSVQIRCSQSKSARKMPGCDPVSFDALGADCQCRERFGTPVWYFHCSSAFNSVETDCASPQKSSDTVTLVCGPYPRCHELTVYTSRPLNENGCYGDFFARTTYYCFMVDPG